MKTPVKQARIFVGLSGGVDSAVTAALLKREGHDVVGVFVKGWYPPELPCTWSEDRRDAMRVAARLGIPFTTLDASSTYKKSVIDYIIREYKEGRTPNPDIFCNRDIKFGEFFTYAKAQGAQYIATGHYAKAEDGRLFRGADEAKDQSYFLWAVPKEALSHTIFPLGERKKPEIRALAKQFDLPVADKRDSQGICFLGPVSIHEFLKNELGSEPGSARSEAGEVVGTHEGAVGYTLGERVALQGASSGPWYVVKKDIEKNELTVAKELHGAKDKGIALHSTNFFIAPQKDTEYGAQYRYHGPKVSGVYDPETATFTSHAAISEPVASGQSLVLYLKDECIGGGIIS